MKKHYIAIVFGTLLLAGCNTGDMISTQYDSTMKNRKTIRYSKYYDAGDWLIKDKVGLSIVIDHEKRVIPVLYSIQRFMGALGPGDMYAKGNVTVCGWNVTEEKHQIQIEKIVSGSCDIQKTGNLVTLEPKSATTGKIGSFSISNFETQIPIEVYYEADGEKGILKLTCMRRTYEDLKKYFGPNSTSPYPWGNALRNPK